MIDYEKLARIVKRYRQDISEAAYDCREELKSAGFDVFRGGEGFFSQPGTLVDEPSEGFKYIISYRDKDGNEYTRYEKTVNGVAFTEYVRKLRCK